MCKLKKITDLIDPNWWAEHIGEKSGIFEKARNSKIRAWGFLGLEDGNGGHGKLLLVVECYGYLK